MYEERITEVNERGFNAVVAGDDTVALTGSLTANPFTNLASDEVRHAFRHLLRHGCNAEQYK